MEDRAAESPEAFLSADGGQGSRESLLKHLSVLMEDRAAESPEASLSADGGQGS